MQPHKLLQSATWWDAQYEVGQALRWTIWDAYLADEVARELDGINGAVLVLGCGHGWCKPLLQVRVPNVRLHGVDCSQVAAKNSNFIVFVHDLNQRPWPYLTGEFRAVIATEILEHLEDPAAAVAEAHRLAPVVIATLPVGDFFAGPATRWKFSVRDIPTVFPGVVSYSQRLRGGNFALVRSEKQHTEGPL